MLWNKKADACVATLPFAGIPMTTQFTPGLAKHPLVSLLPLMRQQCQLAECLIHAHPQESVS